MPSPGSARQRAFILALLATALSVVPTSAASARVTPERQVAVAKSRVARLATSAKRTCARADRVRSASARRSCRAAQAKLRRARRTLRAVAAAAAQNRRAAPVLTVSGQTISWKRVADVDRYKLATKVPGQATAYRVVSGLKVTPSAVPGKTVTYGLRTDVDGSVWAREVNITYPASSPAPAPTPAPAPAPAPAPTAFEAGIVSGSDVVNEARYVKPLAPKVARVEFNIWQPASDLRAAIAAHAANGTRVVLLAGFHATMPTADQARNLAG
jgi:hypothetical protein